MSKQAARRKLARLRAELHAAPWAIDARVLGMLDAHIASGDLEAVRATLSLGRDSVDSITKLVNGVAIIPVTGVLRDEVDFMVRWGCASSYQLIEKDFNQAIDNSQVKGILLYCNSPGGSAIGCKRLADAIFEARGEKPIRAYVQGVCGSACYYIAGACDRIEATADSLVGSVGTIFPHSEYSGMLKEMGISFTVFTNADSPKKGHGNMYEPLSDAAKKTLQEFVDSYGRPFVEDIARYRGIDAAEVTKNFGQGDALRADAAIERGMVDAIVLSFEESLESISSGAGAPVEEEETPPAEPTDSQSKRRHAMNERIKAQLFALGVIDSLTASDKECKIALGAWFKARNQTAPVDEGEILANLQQQINAADPNDTDLTNTDDEDGEPDKGKSGKSKSARASNVQAAHENEQAEARLENLAAAAQLMNETLGSEKVTLKMVADAAEKKLGAKDAAKEWIKIFAESESAVSGAKMKVTSKAGEQYAKDVVEALVYRAASNSSAKISDGAAVHVRKPLWAIAGECLAMSGHEVDMYGDKESLALEAMQMSAPGQRHTFYSEKEGRQYIGATGTPMARPGDFPNILSALANKFLDTIELDQDYSYPDVSAVLPGGLSDFKPAIMINKGIVEELDELQDAEQFKELGLSEEVLSYIFLRRFGNKWGWTPVMIANDDLGAFVEGMIGLDEAWQVTQNRLVVDQYSSNPTLLDGNALFSDRANTGSGTNPALNNNDRTSGGAPSDDEWAAMEALYADIGGVATGRRVRGAPDTIFVPTGAQHQAARRTFMPLGVGGLEDKTAATTTNVGIYRGLIKIIPESELRVAHTTRFYALRSPTRLNTATVVRGYFNGFGQAGRRERWYDPESKTTWTSLEGRIAVAIKNFRYAIRNKGAA